jgi:hypothetical protein
VHRKFLPRADGDLILASIPMPQRITVSDIVQVLLRRASIAALHLGTLLAALSLFASLALPLLDHHYAERMPEHGHVYLAAGQLSHAHVTNIQHSHQPDEAVPAVKAVLMKQADDGPPAGVSLAASVARPVSLGGGQTNTRQESEVPARPETAGVAPVEEPPRAGL